jgi:hypothetical protein
MIYFFVYELIILFYGIIETDATNAAVARKLTIVREARHMITGENIQW